MDEPEAENPLEQLLRALLGPEAAAEASRQMQAQGLNPAQFAGTFGPGAMMNLRHLFSTDAGPVNWHMVEEISIQQAYQSGDPQLNSPQTEQTRQALRVADLWLDPVTDFVVTDGSRNAWTRVDWVKGTIPGWKPVVEPIASNASRAMADAVGGELSAGDSLPPEIAGLAASMSQALPRVTSMMFGSQVGQALGAMSAEALSSSDAGIPLVDTHISALIPTNIEAFAEGLDIPVDEVLQYVAVRECAHVRLFASVPWLRTDVLQALDKYASEIGFDTAALEETARSIDPSDLSSISEVVGAEIFSPEPTEDQVRALNRLETMLALIEGWVEVVTTEATAPYLPHADQLREMMRRRRVTGSAADQMLAQMVGLEMRPRAARDAAALFGMLDKTQREELWSHPDRLPNSDQLLAPEEFLKSSNGEGSDEMDNELKALLDGTLGWADGLEPGD